MKHYLYTLLLCLCPALPAPAQNPPPPLTADQIMQQATLIFEGQLVQTVSYFNAARNRQYHTSLIRLSRLLKGQLRPGTVPVVYRGVRAEAILTDPKTGEITIQVAMPPSHGPSDVFGIRLPEHQPILFFCRPLPATFAPKPKRLTATNPAPLEIVGLAYDLFGDLSIRSDVGGAFPDWPALYRYLNTTYALPIPQ
ncbi:hypothetical protein [Hymenobacter sp. CRA2]|uniref:hypothetical protein n=1 Tax=Hymenobacter sp. CRA2 TaxID=1955620 RepID=UPI00098ED580|nr:hypothetical protein [Hymenobacter sp. CRA2]OON66903.1 hypothetical protein B0919_20145 [Hymenobacter sp. CRA2]